MISKYHRRLVAAVFAAAIFVSCSEFPESSSSLHNDNDPWAKQAWIDKAARALRLGAGLSPSDDVEALASKPKDEIVDLLMQDPRFIETVLDFNLYFLNFKPAKLYRQPYDRPNEKEYDGAVFGMPQALTAAQAVASNADYFSLFHYEQPLYISGFRPPYAESNENPDISEREQRLVQLRNALSIHDELTEIFNTATNPATAPTILCAQLNEKVLTISSNLFAAGLPDPVLAFLDIYFDLQVACFTNPDLLDPETVYQTLVADRDRYAKLMRIVDHPAAMNHSVQNPSDLLAIDPEHYGIPGVEANQFTGTFWQFLPNSSTNYNRRRAAHILKTYFCDDLTPINIALPQSHSGNKHADDPGCAACHYKLDPMAGFFRYNGVAGMSFEKFDFLIFDDAAQINASQLDDYLGSWRAPSDAGREWNVGYIRSPKKTQLNSYGESLRDLAQIIRDSKEVRQCLTRRMAEYFLGKEQVFDGEWINSLAMKFDQAAASPDPGASSRAFKEVAKDLVLSTTFSTPDPEATQCYDFVPGHQPTTLPCEVAYVIKKNCSNCHSGEGASGNLDLSAWQRMSDGSFSFSHGDDEGAQLPKSETFKRLLERLSTNDESKLMPLNKHMSATERAQLYKWVNKEGESAQGEH